ncbi:hypothetical protein JOD82_001866 [Paenibacillus sp. 1182]|nr:hypothetical protein [Paenibacillus sp. 1182]MBP1308846.1 hypothetical protein [Paenibacillus sp. 1182]
MAVLINKNGSSDRFKSIFVLKVESPQIKNKVPESPLDFLDNLVRLNLFFLSIFMKKSPSSASGGWNAIFVFKVNVVAVLFLIIFWRCVCSDGQGIICILSQYEKKYAQELQMAKSIANAFWTEFRRQFVIEQDGTGVPSRLPTLLLPRMRNPSPLGEGFLSLCRIPIKEQLICNYFSK